MKLVNFDDAVNFIMESENQAIPFIDVDSPHSEIRNPKYTVELLESLGRPDKGQFNIKVTGSKGKGSVSKLLASILESQGFKVGLFTGPHLLKFSERIRINNKIMPDEKFIEYANEVKAQRDKIMENAPKGHYLGRVGTSLAMALRYFEDEGTDINIIELGIGAKYDEGNRAIAKISVINPIFAEHLRELGGTYMDVAESKSYIIEKGQKRAFSACQRADVGEVLDARAASQGVDLVKMGEDFFIENISVQKTGTSFDARLSDGQSFENINLNLLGRHQAENACMALEVAREAMESFGKTSFDKKTLYKALDEVEWTGRFEIISKDPLTIMDGAINRLCAVHVKETLEEIGSNDNVFIVGVPDDKDFLGSIKAVGPVASSMILTKAKNKKLHFDLDQYELVKTQLGDEGLYKSDNIEEAMEIARGLMDEDKSLVIMGTQSLIADTKKYMAEQNK